jgi:hypothetical protein
MSTSVARPLVCLACLVLAGSGCADGDIASQNDNDRITPGPIPDADGGATDVAPREGDALADGRVLPDGGAVGDASESDTGDGGGDAGYVTPGGDAGRTCESMSDCPTPTGTERICTDTGRCAYRCESRSVDLDGDILSNGCECQITNGGIEACDGKDNDCDGEVDEAFDLQNDPDNCGACGNTCDFANGMGTCRQGSCELTGCESGWGNCDKSAVNGCEVNTNSSNDHCGSCGNTCNSGNGQVACSQGACRLTSCKPGFADCNGNTNDGCEANVNNDTDNCGGCGLTCDRSHTRGVSCSNGACELDNGCQPGWKNCDGDIRSNGCEQNVSNSIAHCGACNNRCDIPNARNACQSGSCVLQGCKTGFHDLNNKKSDGCEYQCTFQSSDDEPDRKGNDENCDGIDGDRDQSVFVATPQNGGDDSNGGRSPGQPVASIDEALSIASNCNPECDVLVSAGTYDETVRVEEGVDVYGGYTAKDWDRDINTHQTIVSGQQKRTLIATGLNDKTEYDGLTIRGRDFRSQGESTYAVWVEDTKNKNLLLDNARIEAGDGGDGSDGQDGSDGADGGNGRSAGNNVGAAGGGSPCGSSGGSGGSSFQCNSQDGQQGRYNGQSNGGAGGSAGKSRCARTGVFDKGGPGKDGKDGSNGRQGNGGSAPTDSFGSFSNGLWTGDVGDAGTSGEDGRGGGGGGSGGADKDATFSGFKTLQGGGGGGGGAGGCGGEAGEPGKSGGGSFGIVLVDSTISARSTTVVLGNGGDGGRGGDGGGGGDGGSGGSGDGGSGGSDDGGGPGGNGGDGGVGGGGGGGAGGCGGPAIGTATIGSSQLDTRNVTYRSGSGGTGGDGGRGGQKGGSNNRAPGGDEGCQGPRTNTRSY